MPKVRRGPTKGVRPPKGTSTKKQPRAKGKGPGQAHEKRMVNKGGDLEKKGR